MDTSGQPPSPSDYAVVARLACDVVTALRLADALAESLDTGDAAIAAVEGSDGGWMLEVHFARAPAEAPLRAAIAAIAGDAAARALAIETIAARDWVAASLAGLKPVAAGRFLVHGAHDRTRIPPHRVGIEIEAALAFGTGHHGTTRGCLLALDALAKRRRRNVRVLDIGTGSGVLAIAAAKVLRERVVATDIDRRAVETARANARANRVGALMRVVHAGGLADHRLRGPFDLVFANILLTPLKRLAAPIAGVLAPDAHVILSGLLGAQKSAALAAYRAQGLALAAQIPLDEWITLVLRRHNAR